MNILIVKLSSIGDVIHTLPILPAIKDQIADAHISWVVETSSAEMLRQNPLIDNLIEIDTRSLRKRRQFGIPISRQFADLRTRKYDVAIDFQGLLKSAAIARLSGAKTVFGFDRHDLREPASRLLTRSVGQIGDGVHIIRKNLKLLERALKINVPDDGFEFQIHTNEIHKKEALDITADLDGPFVLLNPAGGWPTKLWPAENYGELATLIRRDLSVTPIIVTGPGEDDLADRVLTRYCDKSLIWAKPSLKTFYELARLSALYVGGDTGPTHLALAAGTPIVGIFGPTEWWRNGSTLSDDICIERIDIDCRVNCHRRSCSNWICMDISVEAVFDAVVKRLHLGR